MTSGDLLLEEANAVRAFHRTLQQLAEPDRAMLENGLHA